MPRNILNAYFATHKTCNLNCRYCYIPKYNKNSRKIEDSEILRSLDVFLAKVESEGFALGAFCLHGSEPALAEPETVAEIARKVAAHREKSGLRDRSIAMQSNGVRFNEDYLARLAENLDSQNQAKLGFSIDPPNAVHDYLRGGSFDKVERNLDRAIDRGFPTSILSVVSDLTFDYLDGFLDWIAERLEQKRRTGNPYKIKFKIAAHYSEPNQEQKIELGARLADRDMLELVQILTPGYCLQAGNECEWYEFGVDGACYSCNKAYSDEGIFANWKKESLKDIYKKRKKLYIENSRHPECAECPYELICNSGCPLDRSNSGKAVECSLIKTAFGRLDEKGVHFVDFYNSNL